MAAKRGSLIPVITSEDISRDPDQASFKINQIRDRVNSIWGYIYPVGSYYRTSDTNFNPETVWGGKWQQISAGEWRRTA